MGVKAPGSPFRVIRAEDAEVSILGLSVPIREVIKEVEVRDTRTIELLNLQIQQLHQELAKSQKESAELRGRMKTEAKIVEVPVEKIVEKIVEQRVEVPVERIVDRIIVKVDPIVVAAVGLACFAVGAIGCYILR